jgi:ubiquinol-cytochrome c reductase cytochrome c1 subunit
MLKRNVKPELRVMPTFLSRLALAATLSLGMAGSALAAEGGATPERQSWSFSGIFGSFDRAQLQRGFLVFKTICANCHTMNMPFRRLGQPGGPEFSEEQVAAIAAGYEIDDINEAGEPIKRPGKPADSFPPPYPNVNAAISLYGAYPPNMQVIAKARTYTRGFPYWVLDMFPGLTYQEHGVDYIYALLAKGYVDPPEGFVVPEGGNYNRYMPGNVIKMAAPLADGGITYPRIRPDGTIVAEPDGDDVPEAQRAQLPAGVTETVDQYAKDVTAFLFWVAEPHLEQRKRIGFQVLLFLGVFLVLLFYTKKRVWARAHAAEAH